MQFREGLHFFIGRNGSIGIYSFYSQVFYVDIATLTFYKGGRVSLVKHLLPTYTGNSVANADIRRVQIVASLQVGAGAESEWTMEGIDRRAHYVGPVLEGILREMEAHWRQNQDAEL